MQRGDYMEIRARPQGLIFMRIFKRKESIWRQLSQPAYLQV
nr:MAG TPA: hypothetical protein [Caudoviricetes sp.]